MKDKLTDQPKKSFWSKTILLVFSLLVVVILFLPTVISKWGKDPLLLSINNDIEGFVYAESLELSWFGPQKIIKGTLEDANHEVILTVDSVSVPNSLFDLLLNKKINQGSVDNLNGKLIQYKDRSTNIQNALNNTGDSDSSHPVLEVNLNSVNGSLEKIKSNKFSFLLTGKTDQNGLEGSFNINISAAGINDFESIQGFNLDDGQNIKLSAQLINFPVSIIDSLLSLKKSTPTYIFQLTFGQSLNLSLNQTWSSHNSEVELDIKSPQLNGAISGIIEDNVFHLDKQANVRFLINPNTYREWLKLLGKPALLELNDETNAELFVDELILPFDFFFNSKNTSEIILRSNLRLNDANFYNKKNKRLIHINELTASLSAPKDYDLLRFDIRAEGTQNNTPLNLELKGATKKPFYINEVSTDLRNVKELQIEGKDLPFSLLGEYTEITNPIFEEAIGEVISFKINVAPQDDKLPVIFSLKSPNLSFQARGEVVKDLFNLTAPLLLDYQIPAYILDGYLNSDWIKQNKSIDLKAVVDPFTIPLNDFLNIKEIKGKVDVVQLNGVWTKPVDIGLNIHANLNSLSMTTEVIADDLKGNAHLNLQQFALFNSEDYSLNDAIIANFSSENFPVTLFRLFKFWNTNLENKALALVGNTFVGSMNINLKDLTGYAKANLSGQNGKFYFNGHLNHGVLQLNEPLKIESVVTPFLAEHVIKDVFPLLQGVKSAEKPLTIMINPENFRISLFPLDLTFMNIGSGIIDLGRMSLVNEGDFSEFLGMLKVNPNEELSVWFTPLYFSIEDGVIKINRLDFLLMNSYPLSAWGKINLIKEKVSMVLGISGLTLRKAFNVSVQNNYIMQLPFKGKIGEASIDKKKATSRITALVAHSQGIHGKLIGTFLDLTDGKFNEEKPPEPTTNPLPWEGLLQSDHHEPEPLPKEVFSKTKSLLNNFIHPK